MGEEIIRALNGLNLKIYKNDYVAIMGPSGSGKSTLMNMIGCLDTPTSGDYILNGTNVSNMSENELASVRNREIGFVFQTFNLLPRSSALENVALPLIYAGKGRAERTEIATKVLKDVGLSDRMYHKPNELSGGQRQRVAVARALVNNPSIVLADEPTGNLDSKNSSNVFSILKELSQESNLSLLVVTHDHDFAAKTDRIITMEDGKIIDLGNS
jgi:putative ABC transport system ATP-binding protein